MSVGIIRLAWLLGQLAIASTTKQLPQPHHPSAAAAASIPAPVIRQQPLSDSRSLGAGEGLEGGGPGVRDLGAVLLEVERPEARESPDGGRGSSVRDGTAAVVQAHQVRQGGLSEPAWAARLMQRRPCVRFSQSLTSRSRRRGRAAMARSAACRGQRGHTGRPSPVRDARAPRAAAIPSSVMSRL